MSFFTEPPEPTVDVPDDEYDPASEPVWAGPPWHVRPGVAALSVVIGRSATTEVAVEGARAYPEGAVLRLVVRVRETGGEARSRVFTGLEREHGRGRLGDRLRAGALRWGVETADGRRVTTLDESPWMAGPPDDVDPAAWMPDRPVLEGLCPPDVYGSTWSRDVWLWPLPPPGPLRFGCAWADRDLAETTTDVDAAPLRDAAGRAEALWPDDVRG